MLIFPHSPAFTVPGRNFKAIFQEIYEGPYAFDEFSITKNILMVNDKIEHFIIILQQCSVFNNGMYYNSVFISR